MATAIPSPADGTDSWRFEFDDSVWNDAFDIDCVVDENTVYVNRDDTLGAVRS
jgi:hypothetical protein